MPYTFRMVFSGLCAFVPNRLASDGAPASSWSVLIPELSRSRRIIRPVPEGGNDRRIQIPPHFPSIVFPRRFLDQSTKPTTLFFRRPMEEESGVALLDSERLLIRFPEQARQRDLKPDLRPREADLPDFAQGPWSLRWLIAMEEMLAGAGEVQTQDLFSGLRPQEGTLAGHILLDDGILHTHSFAEPGRNVALWRFEDPEDAGGPAQGDGRPVAYTVALEIPDAEGPVELRFEKPDAFVTRRQSLMLAPDPEVSEIEVTLNNREFEEVVGLGDGTFGQGSFDRDVEIHHTLSAQAGAVGRRLPRLAGAFPEGGLGGERLTCGEVEFTGFDGDFDDRLDDIASLLQAD